MALAGPMRLTKSMVEMRRIMMDIDRPAYHRFSGFLTRVWPITTRHLRFSFPAEFPDCPSDTAQ